MRRLTAVPLQVRLHSQRRSDPSLGLSRAFLSFRPEEVWYGPPFPTPDAVPDPATRAPGDAAQPCRAGRLAVGLAVAQHRDRPAPRTPWADDLGIPLHDRAHLL